jgi:hypothetical protein
MKKILIALVAGMFLTQACNKEYDNVSQVQTVSYPTITFTGLPFYSININGAVPAVSATSFDSTIGESYPVVLEGTDAIDNTTPGLYIIKARATNKYGMYSLANVYVAVTDIPATTNISGKYKRVDVGTGGISIVSQLARGLYQLDNLGGVDRTARPDLLFPVLFVPSNDSTLLIPRQDAVVGTVAVKDTLSRPNQAIFRHLPADTNYKYAITSPSTVFGGALRTFRKQ